MGECEEHRIPRPVRGNNGGNQSRGVQGENSNSNTAPTSSFALVGAMVSQQRPSAFGRDGFDIHCLKLRRAMAGLDVAIVAASLPADGLAWSDSSAANSLRSLGP